MLEVADLIRRFGAAVRARLGSGLLPSQARALRDLVTNEPRAEATSSHGTVGASAPFEG